MDEPKLAARLRCMADSEQANSVAPTRRKMLQVGAVGAGVAGAAWVTPSVLTLDALSAASGCSPSTCTPAIANFLTTAGFGAGTNICDGAGRLINGTTLTASRTNTDTTNQMSGVNCSTQNPTTQTGTTGVIVNSRFGNIPTANNGTRYGQIPLVVNGSAASCAVTLNFNPGVRKLSFTLTDIDSVVSNYQEQVVISWTTGSGTATPTYTPGAQVIATPATSNTFQAATDSFNAPCNSAASNLGVQFDNCGTITSLTITSNDLITIAGGSTRVVGIALLSWCV